MKKVLFLLLVVLVASGCTCSLSQIPHQYIYAGPNCTAPLPDYRNQVTVTGGCTGFTITQTPVPGTLLSASGMNATVVIKAVTPANKSAQIQFQVTMLDTITPKITPFGSLVAYQMHQADELYDAGDKITATLLNYIGTTNDDFKTKLLLNVSMDSAGYRKRFTTYLDSLSFPIWVQDTTGMN